MENDKNISETPESAKDHNLGTLRKKAAALPLLPGVYIMKNKKNEIIYIGKAKKLRNRVTQYFGAKREHAKKVEKMISNVSDFEYILTDSEFEALVLECNLIKRHMPKYNILLKDDKGYSYIKITNEDWPRISECKTMVDDGSEYIGPYLSNFVVKSTVDEVQKIFKLPDCNRKFTTKKNISSKPCLNYYIGRCSAPCAGKIKKSEYMRTVEDGVKFIKSGSKKMLSALKWEMEKASENLEFEKAASIRDRIRVIEKINQNQKVVSNKVNEQDVISMVSLGNKICFGVLRFLKGSLYDKEEFILDDEMDEQTQRAEFLAQYYEKRRIPKIITLDGKIEGMAALNSFLSDKANIKVKINIPQKGEQFKLVNMCKKNAEDELTQYLSKIKTKDTVLQLLQKSLNLDVLPYYIESYDISNISGSDNVAGMVAFENAKPLKSAYRTFKIKDVLGQDDYASMEEVILRRCAEYGKATDKSVGFGRLPNLILVDGGKGQVSVTEKALHDNGLNIPVCGMVKDSNHKTRALIFNNKEIDIIKDRTLFAFITFVQDEVHRFSVKYHHKRRKKSTLKSILTDIPGIGEKRATILLSHFKSISRIKLASVEELAIIPGMNKACAESVASYFENTVI